MDLEKMMIGKRALLFDCDGTLADTMECHKQAYKLAFEKNNIPFKEEVFDACAPFGGDFLMRSLLDDENYETMKLLVIADKKMFLGQCLDQYMVPNTILIDLIKQQYGRRKIAVVSNGRRGSIEQILDKLGIIQYLSLIITKESVKKAKPEADPYILALNTLGLGGEDVIVFEDNKIGRVSAERANIKDIIMVEVQK
jgi:beta-phosphoglucomutase-like phosphatase (HAD superfamily)